ncbi:MAG TPA: outer membrane beta-barrel protein [Kofleriaceae bacterium]|nr:outer membrane beta-barrel protein [Kofleriaceae bacterium]
MLRNAVVIGLIASLTSVASADDEWTGAQPAPPPSREPAPPDDPQPPPPPPPTSPPPATTPDLLHTPAPPPAVMNRRWSVGLSFGWETLTIQHGDKQKVTFGMLELAGRFRITPAIEVALALQGGGTEGDIGLGGIYADFRYRFRVERPWNLYAFAGLGAVNVAQKMASDDEKAGRGSLRLGGGLERRFTAFALNVEVRLASVGENKKAPEPVMPSTANQLSRYGLGGGAVMIGVTYYF